jgi:hypothetical protein
LQIVLSGQPQLADKLSKPNLTQLRQRISVISRLHPFTRVETMVYLEYRLCKAGYSGPPLFGYDAVELIATNSKGIPRNINNLCFNALTLGFAKRQKQIDAETINEVIADLDLESLRTDQAEAPEASEDALVSFDGISPSNELTYQDFHDAVRSAWGNGTPVKSEDKAAQYNLKWTTPNSTKRPADAIVPMSLDAEEIPRASLELNHDQGEESGKSLDDVVHSVASAVAVAVQEALQEQECDSQSETDPTPVVMSEVAATIVDPSQPKYQPPQPVIGHGQHESPVEPAARAISIRQCTAQRRGLNSLLGQCEAVFRTLQGVYKKETGTSDKVRALRRGTVVAIGFALTASSLLFAWQHRVFVQTSPNVGSVAPSPGLVTASQSSWALRDNQRSKIPPKKMSLSSANKQRKPAGIPDEHGQRPGGVSPQALGHFDPQVTPKVQMSSAEIRNHDLIIAGTQISQPEPTIRPDISTPSTGEVLNRSKEEK